MTDFDTIPFFTDDITIVPHSATEARHIGKPISIREFSTQHRQCCNHKIQLPCSLYGNKDNGDLRVEIRGFKFCDRHCQIPVFIEGPETA